VWWRKFLSWNISLCDLEPSYCQLLKRGKRWNKFLYGINDEKWKSREDYIELRILYLIWVLGALYYQEGYIGWVGAVQTIKILSHHQKILSGQTYPAPSQILETLAGHVQPVGQTCPASQPFPYLTKHIRLLGWIPEAFPGHVWPLARTCPT
jgi:hypothetical protein